MLNRKIFFDGIRHGPFDGKLSKGQVEGISSLLDEFERRPDLSLEELAYILATAKWETAHTMQPIAEIGKGKGRKYGVKDKTGQVAYGRGYVQLTWTRNYEKADENIGLDGELVKDYDLALRPDIAAQILFQGMADGWFTGKKLANYFDGETGKADFFNARKIVNGLDRAREIANIAKMFYADLQLSREAT